MSVRIRPRKFRNKSNKVNWPLSSTLDPSKDLEAYETKRLPRRRITGFRGTGSFYSEENQTPKILFNNKTITVHIQRGTKKIQHSLNSNSLFGKNSKLDSSAKHMCNTCKTEIGPEISRILIMRDKDGGPRVLFYHFFFPCWDMELLCQEFPNLVIDKLGFNFPENTPISESSKNDMQNSLKFWN